MPYDATIPKALQLLRAASDTPWKMAVFTFSTDDYGSGYLLADASDEPATMDIAGAFEETLHTLLDHGATPEDVHQIMGLVQIDGMDVEDRALTPIDLGYCIEGNLLSFDKLPDAASDLDRCFNVMQRDLVRTVAANLPESKFLSAAQVITAHDYTYWQAYQLCEAIEGDLDAETINSIADPSFNHAQMRALRSLAKALNFDDSIGLARSFFTRAADPAFPAEKLRALTALVNAVQAGPRQSATITHQSVDNWLTLDADQLTAIESGYRAGLPGDLIEHLTEHCIPAQAINATVAFYYNGMEREGIDRFLKVAENLTDAQCGCLWQATQELERGLLTREKLDVIANPALDAETMWSLLDGFDAFGLTVENAQRYVALGLSANQLSAINRLTIMGTPQTVLDAVIDPDLSPDDMIARADVLLNQPEDEHPTEPDVALFDETKSAHSASDALDARHPSEQPERNELA